MPSISLDSLGVDTLSGVGPALASKLHRLGLFNLQDLLFHLPLRYIDRTQITPIGAIQPLTEVVIEGEIRASDVVLASRELLSTGVFGSSGRGQVDVGLVTALG